MASYTYTSSTNHVLSSFASLSTENVPSTTPLSQYAHHPDHHRHNHNSIHRSNYYSNTTMWICCQCNDGPKVLKNSDHCVMCHHYYCDCCTVVK